MGWGSEGREEEVEVNGQYERVGEGLEGRRITGLSRWGSWAGLYVMKGGVTPD